MSDAELIERLRDLGIRSANIAADRIDALTAQLAEDADARALMDARIEELVAQVDALTAERDALRAAFRVNMLRLIPGVTHADIDAVISAALNTGKADT